MKAVVAAVSALAGILLFLLAAASSKSSVLIRNYPLLLGLNGSVAALLLGLVGFQVRTLWIQYREHQFGSRLKVKLLGLFALMALVPGLVIYGVSLQFATRSIESWFDVKVDAALDSGIQLGRNALDYLLEQLANRAKDTAEALGESLTSGNAAVSAARLDRLRDEAGADTAALLAGNGKVLVSSVGTGTALAPESHSSATLRLARGTRGLRTVEGEGSGELWLRVIVPIPARNLATNAEFLQMSKRVPPQIARTMENIQNGNRDYQELLLGREGLMRIYGLTLTLTLLLALFAAIAAAFEIARSLSAPLSILAEGTQAVAAGDFSPRQALPGRDELGVLTQSFNRMTRQLQDARGQAERSRAEVEAARVYLESVLGNLSAGVLAFSDNGRLRAANRGAMQILGDDLAGFETLTLETWPRHHAFRDAVLRGFDTNDEDWARETELTRDDGRNQTLLLRGSRLPPGSAGGYVVVFDDVTELISAQRNAAWAEVARRLAHEIKNPLTPIQLSAERLQHKLSSKLDPDSQAMLARATQTIVNQVEAMKNMVNDFRDYARMPPATLAPLDLNALIREVLGLYESSRVRIELVLAADLPRVLGDPTQLRQVIHNLLTNAEDALVETDAPQVSLLTRREGRRVEFLVRDNGPGFPPAMLARAFEPYVTSKARGSGLGLAIVKKIADEHRGDITITNIEPHGAEIRLRLPLAPTV
ncbi:ATP-binding protein [Niveibacterium umoris]|uniref:histidine kinase n=1 Tax=Niveibacterium umoris TaxID=1193620 RepID=A0A840BMY9_9RHOO|nr:ATP-binding protein [Niveibacterium umoris]MBB4013914.1 nitrogen fixation/metabolism regulation signal transduction histidine kinase [Niveibacterium umoris]